ncbi:MAG: hypothetical protein WC250_01095 [Candidatus Paceibacterota bacterium]|jgi:pimeloyl-ACP methyl ester carboxylesterase
MNFEEQFRKKFSVTVRGKNIYFVDVAPNQAVEVPIFLGPGWGETPNTFKDTIRVLFEAGFRVLCVEHSRQDLKLITKGNLPHLELQKAETILQILEAQKVDAVSLIAHSEGAINCIISASLRPELFRNMILVGPCGLMREETFIKLVGRFILNLLEGVARAAREPAARVRLLRSAEETAKYFLKNPIMGLLEGGAISHTKLLVLLEKLYRSGLKAVIIHGSDDWVFPIKGMRDLRNLSYIDFHLVKGDHHDIYANPKNYLSFFKDSLAKTN